MADKIDQLKIGTTSYDIDLPPNATPDISSVKAVSAYFSNIYGYASSTTLTINANNKLSLYASSSIFIDASNTTINANMISLYATNTGGIDLTTNRANINLYAGLSGDTVGNVMISANAEGGVYLGTDYYFSSSWSSGDLSTSAVSHAVLAGYWVDICAHQLSLYGKSDIRIVAQSTYFDCNVQILPGHNFFTGSFWFHASAPNVGDVLMATPAATAIWYKTFNTTGDFAATPATTSSRYMKIGSFMMCWGYATSTSISAGNKVVAFPSKFQTRPFVLIQGEYNGAGAINGNRFYATSVTNSNFTLATYATGVSIAWIAIGYTSTGSIGTF